MGLPTTFSRPPAGSAAPPVYDSVRTAMGTDFDAGDQTLTLAGPAGGCVAGDLIVVCIKLLNDSALDEYVVAALVDGTEAMTLVATQPVGGGNGHVGHIYAYLCSSARPGAVTVTAEGAEGGYFPASLYICGSRFTNVSSATPNRLAYKGGTSGTTYSTDAVSTTAKCVTVGLVTKYSGSTGTWGTDWTDGQGVVNHYSEGYGLNLAAASRQTYKAGGTSTFWGALFAAFPVRTS